MNDAYDNAITDREMSERFRAAMSDAKFSPTETVQEALDEHSIASRERNWPDAVSARMEIERRFAAALADRTDYKTRYERLAEAVNAHVYCKGTSDPAECVMSCGKPCGASLLCAAMSPDPKEER